MRKMTVIRAIYLFCKNIAGYFNYFFISFLFRRNKKIWIYGSYGGSFRDNSKYFYLYCCKHLPGIKHIWISSSKQVTEKLKLEGFNACNNFSFAAIRYALTAKVYIYNMYTSTDLINGSFRGNAFLFNFWHGVPFKKIEHDITTGPSRVYQHPANVAEKLERVLLMEPRAFRKSCAVLSTSEKLVPIFSSAFQLPKEKILVGPYPRNSIFNFSKEDIIKHTKKIESQALRETVESFQEFNKVIIYMPTFRDTHSDFISQAFPDFDKLHQVCKENNILFFIKVHTLTKFSIDFSKYCYIKNLDSSIDVYPLLPFTDALISDYSSIIFDYSLLRKKIIFYAFDKDEYLKTSRESYFEYEEVFSDDITYTFTDLLKEIELLGKDDSQVEYNYPLSSSFHQNNAGLQDIAEYIKKSINY